MNKIGFFGDSFLISFDRVFDERGFFQKIYSDKKMNFKEQYFSVSKKNVLRGIHFQLPPHDHEKLVYCVKGKVLDLIIDLRLKSPNFMKFKTIILDDSITNAIYIPKGFGHGFLSLSHESILNYNTSTVYEEKSDHGIHWSSIGYDWPISKPIISHRDNKFPKLESFVSPFVEKI